ncbi:MAG: tRNA glutamyl-Q(34) synthetase GluQRS [Rhodospirillaceae bacterium]
MPPDPAAPVTRFAPSPTGHLHLGHAYSAWFAWAEAAKSGGRFLLRIEDIDQGRCRPEFEDAVYEDLAWLGLTWETPVRRQSDHPDDYTRALVRLTLKDLVYPCFCTRKDIQTEIEAAGRAPHGIPAGPDGPVYPGICRGLSIDDIEDRKKTGNAFAFRLKTTEAIAKAGPLEWTDADRGPQTAAPDMFGDIVLARKDTPTSYHLSVTVDDHIQGVTRVTRGDDLFEATHIHRLLQALLGLKTPEYRHHPLKTDADGNRFAKRDKSLTIRALREDGKSPADVWGMAGVPAGERP